MGIHVLDIFNNFTNLRKLSLSFNALDSFTFERIINLIQTNNNLKCIDLDFKISSEDFTLNSLKRVYLKHYLFSYSQNRTNYIEVNTKSEIEFEERDNLDNEKNPFSYFQNSTNNNTNYNINSNIYISNGNNININNYTNSFIGT